MKRSLGNSTSKVKIRNDSLIYIPPEGIKETARIAIIGEAPGEDEQLEGRPFVGKSGKLVRAAINDSNVPSTRILLINTVCVRPLNNRTPTKKEVVSWLPHLYSHIRYCRSIILLGKTAELAASLISFADRKNFYRMEHPSAALRFKGMEGAEQWVAALVELLQHEA